ncbi:MAG: hypothetical protein ACREF4_17125, partial [Gammaproteobacteria bacterium]
MVFDDGVLQTNGVQYTVDGVGNVNGGNVTFSVAPSSSSSIVIICIIAIDQQTTYPTNDKFPAKVHEDIVDRLTMIAQQLSEVDQRTVKFAVTSLFKNPSLGDPVAQRFLRWKSDLTGIEAVDLLPTGSYVDPITTKGDLLAGGAAGDPERLPVGSNDQILVADSAAGVGVKWTGSLKLADGSVASPSLTFANDTDTGLFRPAADELAFAVKGVKGFRVVGVGSPPASFLSVLAGAAGAGLQ